MNENYGKANDSQRISYYDAHEWNLDKSVSPHTMVRGMMGKDDGEVWQYLRVSTNGDIANADAANFRISAIGMTLDGDADNNRVSAIQKDASNLMVSGRSDDAALFRVSAIGALSASESVSARLLEGTAHIGSVSSRSDDAAFFRISAIGGTAGDSVLVDGLDQTLSAIFVSSRSVDFSGLNLSATPQLMVRPGTEDASELRISAFGPISASQSLSARNLEGTAFIGNVSAKNSDAAFLRVSALVPATVAVSGTVSAHLLGQPVMVAESSPVTRVSADILGGSIDNASFAATQTDAANLDVSAKSNDAGTMRVSASLYPDTVGGLTVHRSLSVSASQNIKSTPGAIYGYYAYNFDSEPSYLKLYNVSGAVNLGTDIPIITIAIPASAAANMQFSNGLKGFTAGIGVAATSGVPDDNTALPAASAVGLNLFYK